MTCLSPHIAAVAILFVIIVSAAPAQSPPTIRVKGTFVDVSDGHSRRIKARFLASVASQRGTVKLIRPRSGAFDTALPLGTQTGDIVTFSGTVNGLVIFHPRLGRYTVPKTAAPLAIEMLPSNSPKFFSHDELQALLEMLQELTLAKDDSEIRQEATGMIAQLSESTSRTEQATRFKFASWVLLEKKREQEASEEQRKLIDLAERFLVPDTPLANISDLFPQGSVWRGRISYTRETTGKQPTEPVELVVSKSDDRSFGGKLKSLDLRNNTLGEQDFSADIVIAQQGSDTERSYSVPLQASLSTGGVLFTNQWNGALSSEGIELTRTATTVNWKTVDRLFLERVE